MQKKTFTKWVNSHLVRVNCKIQDLYLDMRDGKMLIRLLEVLSGERLVSGFRRGVRSVGRVGGLLLMASRAAALCTLESSTYD